MGRGKYDTCENCISAIDNRDGTYTCMRDNKEQDANDWCKYHQGEDE